jgi:hypothetical protein
MAQKHVDPDRDPEHWFICQLPRHDRMGKKAVSLYCPFNVSNSAYLSDELLKKSTVGEGLVEVSVTRRIPGLHILFGPAQF